MVVHLEALVLVAEIVGDNVIGVDLDQVVGLKDELRPLLLRQPVRLENLGSAQSLEHFDDVELLLEALLANHQPADHLTLRVQNVLGVAAEEVSHEQSDRVASIDLA